MRRMFLVFCFNDEGVQKLAFMMNVLRSTPIFFFFNWLDKFFFCGSTTIFLFFWLDNKIFFFGSTTDVFFFCSTIFFFGSKMNFFFFLLDNECLHLILEGEWVGLGEYFGLDVCLAFLNLSH